MPCLPDSLNLNSFSIMNSVSLKQRYLPGRRMVMSVGILAVLILASCSKERLDSSASDDGATDFRNLNTPGEIRYRVTEEPVTRNETASLDGPFVVCAWYHDDVKIDPMKSYSEDELLGSIDPRMPEGPDMPLVGIQIDKTALNWQGEQVFNTGGLWATETTHYWPKNYNTVDFYALYPKEAPYIRLLPYELLCEGFEGSPNFASDTIVTYTRKTVPYSAYPDGEVTDLLYSYLRTSKNAWKDNQGTVNLTFHHALSQISFRGAIRDTNKDWIVEVKDITLHNVFATGTFDIRDGEFMASAMEEKTDYPLAMAGAEEANPYQLTEPIIITYNEETYTENEETKTRIVSYEMTDKDSPRMLLGQKLTAWDYRNHEKIEDTEGCYLELLFHIYRQNQTGGVEELLTPDGTFQTIYIPFSPEWKSGKHYTYTLYFGGGYDEDGWPNIVEPEITVSVTDWVQGEESSGSAEFN